MKVISKYEKIQKREMLDCRVKSLKEILRNSDIELSSYEVLALCGGITFCYTTIDFKQYDIKKIPYVLVTEEALEDNLFNMLQMSYVKEKIEDTQDGWNHMMSLIDHNIPILFKYDSSVFLETKRERINLKYLSLLLLVGYDKKTKDVAVVLTNSNDKESYEVFHYEQFQKYRGTVCIPSSPDYQCMYVLERNEEKLTKDYIDKCLLQSVYKISKKMIDGQSLSRIDNELFASMEFNIGIAGMKILLHDILLMLKSAVLKNKKKRKLVRFKMLFLRDNMLHGSATAFRKEFSESLIVIGRRINIIELQQIGLEFKRISELWSKFFLYIGRYVHGEEGKLLEILKIYIVFYRITKKEEKAFKNLKRVLESSVQEVRNEKETQV